MPKRASKTTVSERRPGIRSKRRRVRKTSPSSGVHGKKSSLFPGLANLGGRMSEADSGGSDAEEDDVPASKLLLSTFGHVEKCETSDDDEASESENDSEQKGEESSSEVEAAGEEETNSQDGNSDSQSATEENEEVDDAEDPGSHLSTVDPFIERFEILLSEESAESAKRRTGLTEEEIALPVTGVVVLKHTVGADYQPPAKAIQNSHVRENLLRNVSSLKSPWTRNSDEYFGLMNSYRDVFHFQKDHQLDMDIKRAYSLHILNHVLKTRNRVIAHNTKLSKRVPDADAPQFRDQGYTRPKVLILLPFRHSAYRIFEILCDLLNTRDEIQVMNKKRFVDEFGWNDKDPVANSDRPEDFRQNFTGNTDDCFRIGVSIAKKTLKLFTEFYSADIIIASPLGLRMIIGNEGEKQYEYDFLSSIEILIMDQADVFLMQNWEHVMHILKHMHRIPSSTKNIDFSRVRPWILNGWSQLYRQTMLFSAFRSPELQSVANRHCLNYGGSFTFKYSTKLTGLSSVIVPVPHSFEKIPGSDIQKSSDARFRYFCDKILPGMTDASKSHTMIFIPSYFDFVRLRNHFKREEISFVQICEYTSAAKITRARDLFFHGKKQIMLYTERFHFYRRYRIRGMRHIIFYEAPHYPQFYSELCNMTMEEEERKLKESSVTCLFSRFDLFRLAPVVEGDKAGVMVQSDKSVHVFVTEPEEHVPL